MALGTTRIDFHALLRINALSNSVTLAHPKDCYDRCLFTDASYDSYSIIIAQVLPEELSKELCDQIHENLAFFSRSFCGSAARLAIP